MFEICWLSVLLLLTSCTESSVQEPVRFYLFKHDNPAITSPIDQSEEDGWLPLLDVDLSQSDFVIEDDDIVSYDWNEQRIKLNQQVNSKFEQGGTTAFDFSFFGMDSNYFVLALGERPVVGGVISFPMSAYVPQIPVLYFSFQNDDLRVTELGLGQYHTEMSVYLEKQEPDIRRRLLEVGKLDE